MATKGRIDMLVRFSCFLLLMGHSYSFLHKLQQGEELKDGDELISATGKFKFGFFTPSSTPDSSKRYVGVWYNKPTDRTKSLYNEDEVRYDRSQMQSLKVVWIANRNNPILHKSSTLRIDSSDGNLKIFPNGENPVAITSVGAVRNITGVSLLKSGNLVLYVPYSNNESINHLLWQSFDYPTDTLLPEMKLGINFLKGNQWFLQSWLTYDSPEQGRFKVGMDPNVTSQLMVSCRGQGDQTSGDLLNGKFKSWNISGYKFSYFSNEQEKYFTYSVSEDVTSFPMLQIDWNGSLRDDRGQSIASCPMFNPYRVLDEYKRTRMCNSSSSYLVPKSGFMSGDGIKFRESDNMTLADCRQKCYKDCSCVAYAATNRANDTGCEIWSRGAMFKESNDDNNREIYVEFIPPVIAKKKWWIARKGLVITVAVALVVILLCSLSFVARRKYKGKEEKWWQSLMVVLLVPLLCYFCYLAWRKLIAEVQTIMNRRKLLRELGDEESSSNFNNGGQTKEKDQTTSHELKIFKFQTIATATNNFSTANKLGEGGFGPVYKGKLLDDREIAIKRLSRRSGQGIVEFKNEAKLIAKLQHTNLVKLVGCSLQGEERILVYEYMHNKSLDFFIFNSDRKKLLDWKKRFNIIEGIAQGLIYLHKYSRLRVIHRDLKASNILLDDQMNPKISDFGTARIFGADESEANTNRVVGTYGYMCPEYAMNGIFSMKTDVFSFGVLVLEIVSGKKNNSRYLTEQPLNLVGYAWQLWNEGKGLELIDTTLDQSCCPNDQVLRCLHVGLLCVQDQATDRPTISDVVSMLTNETMLLPAPKQPTFFTDVNEASEIKLENCSTNNFNDESKINVLVM